MTTTKSGTREARKLATISVLSPGPARSNTRPSVWARGSPPAVSAIVGVAAHSWVPIRLPVPVETRGLLTAIVRLLEPCHGGTQTLRQWSRPDFWENLTQPGPIGL